MSHETIYRSLFIQTRGVLKKELQRNARIASHEAGHATVIRVLGDTVFTATIIPDVGPGGYEGRVMRAGPPSSITFEDSEARDETTEILSICERLEAIRPEPGSSRIDLSEYIVRSQNNIVELCAGEAAELILHPDLPPLGAIHDFVEANAFARVSVASQPAVTALVAYGKAEATALLIENRDILEAVTAGLIACGTLTGDEIDELISRCITARSREAEHRRRQDWQRRTMSAAAFMTYLSEG